MNALTAISESSRLCVLSPAYTSPPFCISSEYRGCGLSAQILGQAISVYRSLGKTWLCAHVAEKNLRAQGFYHKFAFEQRGEHRDANGLHYRMFKRLTAE